MKKQRSQVIALVLLLIFWALLWRFFIRVPHAPPVAAPVAAKAPLVENPLRARFRRLRAEMDVLYHYRIKPTPFDAHWNPFRIPGLPDGPVNPLPSKIMSMDPSQMGIPPPDFAEGLLKSALAAVRIGGVVTMKGTIQLTVDGRLHMEGDVFTVRVPTTKADFKLVRIRIKRLSEAAVTFTLEDTDTGSAEERIRLK